MSKVYLMGVGPGDEELMTVKAVRALKKCTAVMYDRLAGGNVLKHLNEKCEVYYCGKEPGCHYKTQDEINDMLVELARKGHIVGRVKGGDPYVFGRGGEEALRLHEEGIEFEVIPGITSAISVLNYAGIPITHRGVAQSFHVFTGMSAAKLNINWEAVAGLTGTLVFLMGFENLQGIVSNLIENGMSKEKACAVIMRGTTAKQKKVVGKLEDICEKAKENGLSSPSIIVVGEVLKFHEILNWYEKKPLFGCNVCVTRTKEQAKEITEKLLDLGAEVTEMNAIAIQSLAGNLKEYIEKLTNYNYVVLTSVNSVNILFDYLKEAKFDIRKIKAEFAAIGPATAQAIENRGIQPFLVADEFVAEDLFRKMKEILKGGESILLPRSKNARPYLVEAFESIGCNVDEVSIYETVAGKSTPAFENANIALFTSPSTVVNTIKMVGLEAIKEKTCIAIGPITAKELQKHGIGFTICDEYTTDGIIKKLLQLQSKNREE